jgi:hypothetical protein
MGEATFCIDESNTATATVPSAINIEIPGMFDVADDDAEIWEEIKTLTPPNETLLEMTTRMPPPESWFAEDY